MRRVRDRHHPAANEARWRKLPDDRRALAPQQRSLADAAARALGRAPARVRSADVARR